jgi:poly [ADP-ribose] polymerase
LQGFLFIILASLIGSNTMSKKYAMLVKVDAGENNNKFYEIIWHDDDTVTARYGRNGDNGVTEQKGSGEAIFNKVYKAKTSASKGYKEVDILTTSGTTPTTTPLRNTPLIEIAKRDIANNNPVMAALLERLAQINKYELLKATGDQIDIVNGVVQTVLGPVTLDAVSKARAELLSLDTFIQKQDFGTKYADHLNQYLTFIPQKVPRKRGWDQDFFTSITTFQQQNGLLDQIETSIQNYKPVDTTQGTVVEQAKIFGHSLALVEDDKIIDRIKKFYSSNMNHGHASSHLKLKRVYAVANPEGHARYQAVMDKIGNEMQLWHGTRAFNVLSILKGGLIIPTSAGGYHITGRMFGDGLYFSDQSTKSLNYAYGYWGGGSRDNNCFMFLADVSMGKPYVPSGPFSKSIPTGYDSCHAIGGKSGVQNNEMIVYNLNQAKLSYLCEFDS